MCEDAIPVIYPVRDNNPGLCPLFKFRLGDTYASTTKKLLIDPTTCRTEKLKLSDRTCDDFQTRRAPLNEIDLVRARFKRDDPIYKHPTIPGYEGLIPRQHGLFGQRYVIQATEASSEYEQLSNRDKQALNQLSRLSGVLPKTWDPGDLEDKEIVKSEFKLPLLMVRPECATLLRNLPMDEPPLAPPYHFPSPYFLENPDLAHYGKQGYSDQVPFGFASFGKANKPITPGGLYDFTSNYRKRLSTEWAPVSISRPDPPLLIQPSEIYHRHIGHLPNYAGHIPGSIFRFGQTYGNDTRDAKRWLRGDFST